MAEQVVNNSFKLSDTCLVNQQLIWQQCSQFKTINILQISLILYSSRCIISKVMSSNLCMGSKLKFMGNKFMDNNPKCMDKETITSNHKTCMVKILNILHKEDSIDPQYSLFFSKTYKKNNDILNKM